MPSVSKAACCIAPDSEWATGWPMRTTRFVMLAPLRVRGRSRDRRSAAEPGRRTVVSPSAMRPAIANVIASRWSSWVSVTAPVQAACRRGSRCRRPRRDSRAEGREARPRSRRSGRTPCAGARPRRGTGSCPSRDGGGQRQDRDLVDRRRHVGGRQVDGPEPARPHRRGRRGARRPRHPGPRRSRSSIVGAHAPQDVDDGTPRRVRAHPVEAELGVGVDRPGDQPEGRARRVGRDGLVDRGGQDAGRRARTVWAPSGPVVSVDGDAAGAEHPLGVVAGRDRLGHRRLAVGREAGEQDRGLDLGAGDRRVVA